MFGFSVGLGFSTSIGPEVLLQKKLRIVPFRAKVFDRLCWAPSGDFSQLSIPPSSQRGPQAPSTQLHLPVGCGNLPARCSPASHLCLEYGHAECALPCDPTEMTSGYCALINQCVCFLSFTLCLYTFSYCYPIIISCFILYIKMPVTFSCC